MTLQETIARAVERFPAERARIERAATLIALGSVERLSTDVWAIRSQTDADTEYTLTGGTYADKAGGCQCIDSQRNPGQSCKHAWAVDLIQVAEERQRRIDAQDQFPMLTVAEMGRLSAWKRRYGPTLAAR
jgi:hypothetical protein